MAAYAYRGYDSAGNQVSGEIQAGTVEDVENRLSDQSVTVVSIVPLLQARAKREAIRDKPAVAKATGLGFEIFAKKVKVGETATVLRNLAIMAEAGVPLIEALHAVTAGCTNKLLGDSLKRVRADVIGGKSLSSAMRSVPRLFPGIVCDMVRVAEEGGHLDIALDSAATYMERSVELRKKIVNAMLYPAVLMSVSSLAVVFLVTWILPSFATTFKRMGAKLPGTTRFLLDMGAFVRGNPIVVVALVIAMIFGIRWLFKSPRTRRPVFRMLHRIPILGALIVRVSLARTMQAIATLLSSNVPIITALEHGGKVAGDPLIADALRHARLTVENGGTLVDGLEHSDVFPPTLIQMVGVGERTGRLGSLLSNSAAFMEAEADSRLKSLVSIVEPLMILVMAVIVGLITSSIILPIYTLMESVK